MVIILNDWAYGTSNNFQAPEMACIYGKDEDGKSVVIADGISYINRSERKATTESGVTYLFGLPSVEYEKAFPDATNRLFDMIEKKLLATP